MVEPIDTYTGLMVLLSFVVASILPNTMFGRYKRPTFFVTDRFVPRAANASTGLGGEAVLGPLPALCKTFISKAKLTST